MVDVIDLEQVIEENNHLRKEVARLQELVTRDELTGLFNRRAMRDLVMLEVAHAERTKTPLCLAMLDIDNFKQFNDVRGHAGGDRLLQLCAKNWQDALRADDTLIRLSGDEFVVVLPRCHKSEAREVLKRVVEATPMGQSASAGVALYTHGESVENTLERADQHLYSDKDEKTRLRSVS